MNPYRSHNHVRGGILVAFEGLRRRPDMVGQIRGAIGEVICVEEGEWVYEGGSRRDGYEEEDNWMAGGATSILREGASEGMLRLEDWRLSSSREETNI